MNKSPLNYLVAIAIGAILWVVTAVLVGGNFAESLTLNNLTPDDFLSRYRIFLSIGVVLAVLSIGFWFFYGALDSTAGSLGKAKTVWWSLFIVQIVVSIALLFGLVLWMIDEGITTGQWTITFGLLSLLTWFFFWVCTFLWSPRSVKYIPLGR